MCTGIGTRSLTAPLLGQAHNDSEPTSTSAVTGGVDKGPDTFIWKDALVYAPALILHESDPRESLSPSDSHLDN